MTKPVDLDAVREALAAAEAAETDIDHVWADLTIDSHAPEWLAALADEVETLRKLGPWVEYVESHRAMKRERDGDCICDHNPETLDGPDEYCPWHGRAYSELARRVEVLADEVEALRAKLSRVEALADDWEVWRADTAATQLRDALADD